MARPNCLLLILNVLGWHPCELVLWLSFQWMSWLGYAEVPLKPLHFSDLALRVVLTTEQCWVGIQVWEAAVHYVLFSNPDSSFMCFIIPENPRNLFPVSRREVHREAHMEGFQGTMWKKHTVLPRFFHWQEPCPVATSNSRVGWNYSPALCPKKRRMDFTRNGEWTTRVSETVNNSLGVTVFLTSLLIIDCVPRTMLRPGTKRTDSRES